MMQYKRDVVVLPAQASVEIAEELFGWLIEKSGRKVDMSHCQQLHTAVLQTLLICRATIIKPPTDPWLKKALSALLAR